MSTDAPVLTPSAAYASDPTFRLLVDEWVEHRRCPRVLVDRCFELGLDAAADCAAWASDPEVTPDRPVYRPVFAWGERGGECGPYPTAIDVGSEYWFWEEDERGARQNPHRVPSKNIKHVMNINGVGRRPRPLTAILWLLENWKP